jgi:thiamine pyrophosphokinase
LLPKVEEYYRNHGSQIIRDTDQESTDFMKCLKLASEEAGRIAKAPAQKLDVVALGGLGGRIDQGLSQLHHLYVTNRNISLRIRRIILLTPESIAFTLQKGINRIYIPLGRSLTEKVGILPIGRPAVISTKGLEWDVHDWETEFGCQISTSNHVKGEVVEVETTERVVFTIEVDSRH